METQAEKKELSDSSIRGKNMFRGKVLIVSSVLVLLLRLCHATQGIQPQTNLSQFTPDLDPIDGIFIITLYFTAHYFFACGCFIYKELTNFNLSRLTVFLSPILLC